MNVITAVPPMVFIATQAAFAQAAPPAPAEGPGEPISILMFFTLGAALLAAVAAMLWFLRKSSNRKAASRVFNPNDADSR
jgi:hypothetical protein